MLQIENTLREMKALWVIRHNINNIVHDTNQFIWAGLNPDDLEDAAKRMQKMMRTLPRSVRKNPAFKGLNNAVKDFSNTVPLISILMHPSMRMRHCK